jgi:tripartite-type tricarboxylate transporter receptor subunit TctC
MSANGSTLRKVLRPEDAMTLQRRHFLQLAASAAALPAVSRLAWAQAYPTRPITIVVPYPPGGGSDVIARTLAERIRVLLGQTGVIENLSGAGGSIGVGRVARAAPNGYTLCIGNWASHVLNGAIYTLQYDLLKDFEPVALLSSNPIIIVAKNAMPADDLKGLIAWLKANPDKASAATIGALGGNAIAALLFQKETGTRFRLVPYRGGALATQDLVAGQIDLNFDNPTISLPNVRAGMIKAYAITAKARMTSAPDIPTVDEAGLPGFYISNWTGLWLPKGTPKDVIATLNAVAVDTLADPAVRQRLADVGHEIFPREQQTPEALAAYQKAEIEKWWPIIKAANIKGE